MIDVTKIAAFTAFHTGNEDTIARQKDGAVVAGATYHSANIFRWMRSGSTQAANNAIRTEFLRNLGEALGLEGADVDGEGKVRFSEGFMKQLEKTLGKGVLKRDDFAIDKNGFVSSGKPLTERRIMAIVNRVKALAAEGPRGAVIDPKILEAFEEKKEVALDDIKEGFVGKEQGEVINNFFEHVTKQLNAFNSLPDALKDVHDDSSMRQAFYDLTGMICHPEYINVPKKTSRVYLDYAKSVVAEYVNLLMDRFAKDESAERTKSAQIPSDFPCMEGKTSVLQAAKVVDEIGAVVEHDEDTQLSDCIFKEIDAYQKNNPGKGTTWKECFKMLKNHLVGLSRPIDTFEGGTHFDATGNARKVKASDIERLGPYIRETLLMDEE